MSVIIAGVCYVKAGGTQFPLGESCKVRPATVNREPKIGLNGEVRAKETPVSPSVEIECLTTADLDIAAILEIKDATITTEAANGKVYTLTDAFQSGEPEIDLAEGTVSFLFHGQKCIES
jgi:hypothetical protein